MRKNVHRHHGKDQTDQERLTIRGKYKYIYQVDCIFLYSVQEQVQRNSSKVGIQITGQCLWTHLDFGLITDMLPMFSPSTEAVKDLEFLIVALF